MKPGTNQKCRNKTIKARLTEDEYRDFRQQREDSGLSESEFIRRAVFGGKISANNAQNQAAMCHICNIQTLMSKLTLDTEDPIAEEIRRRFPLYANPYRDEQPVQRR